MLVQVIIRSSIIAATPLTRQGVTRDKKTRAKALSLVNPNWPPEQMAKHMSADLGWVRVRAGMIVARSDPLPPSCAPIAAALVASEPLTPRAEPAF